MSGLDETDRKILAALQRNGRIPNAELAESVGLSPSPCLRRLRRLEAEGYIRGYGVRLDRQKVGVGLTAFLSVVIERNRKPETDLLRRQILALDEVVACHIVTGDADFLLEIATPDLRGYSEFVLNVVNKLPGVKEVRSSISLEAVKEHGALPL